MKDEPKPKPPVTIDDPFKEGELPIDLPVTRAVNDGNPENIVKTARLIVIKNSIVANNQMVTVASSDASPSISAVIPVGTIDMFIIVNEDPGWSLGAITVNNFYDSENIEKKTLTFSAYPVVDDTHPIPMYRQFKGLHVSNAGTFTFEGSTIPMADLGAVDRLYAKLRLAVGAVFANMDNGGDPIKIDSMSVKSMPNYSYLTPSVGLLYPASGGYFDAIRNVKTAKYDFTSAAVHDTITWYIPEHRLSDPARVTYISIKASLEDNQDVDEQVEYKIAIGDGASTRPQADMFSGIIPITELFITRNVYYDVSATIKSFDKTNESLIDVTMKVVGWTSVPMDTTDIWQYELKVSQDAFYYPNATDFNGAVTIETNHPEGWSVTTTSPGAGKYLYVDNGSGGATYTTATLPPQTGTILRFRCVGWTNTADVGYIDVKAGRHLVKRIKITRSN
jgi:hypothetical protein